jgi:hypothetical protein
MTQQHHWKVGPAHPAACERSETSPRGVEQLAEKQDTGEGWDDDFGGDEQTERTVVERAGRGTPTSTAEPEPVGEDAVRYAALGYGDQIIV